MVSCAQACLMCAKGVDSKAMLSQNGCICNRIDSSGCSLVVVGTSFNFCQSCADVELQQYHLSLHSPAHHWITGLSLKPFSLPCNIVACETIPQIITQTHIYYQKGYLKVCVPLHSEDEDTILHELETHLSTYSHPAPVREVAKTTPVVQTHRS